MIVYDFDCVKEGRPVGFQCNPIDSMGFEPNTDENRENTAIKNNPDLFTRTFQGPVSDRLYVTMDGGWTVELGGPENCVVVTGQDLEDGMLASQKCSMTFDNGWLFLVSLSHRVPRKVHQKVGNFANLMESDELQRRPFFFRSDQAHIEMDKEGNPFSRDVLCFGWKLYEGKPWPNWNFPLVCDCLGPAEFLSVVRHKLDWEIT